MDTQNFLENSNKRKRKVRLISGLVVLTLVIGIVIGLGIFVKSKIGSNKNAEVTPGTLNAENFPKTTVPADIQAQNDKEWHAYLDDLKKKKSDIEGWSQYDKYKYGLDMQDGSDTDRDGLTDKEELEEYGSDPLKMSTAGDLYTDGEKVKSGVDPLTYVEYDGDKEIHDDDEIFTLYMLTPHDFEASVVDITDYMKENAEHEQTPEAFYKAYRVCAYDNDHFDVDLNKAAELIGLDAKDLDIEAFASRFNEVAYKRSKNVVTATFKDVQPFDSGIGMKGYDVFIIDKQSFMEKTKQLMNNATGKFDMSDDEDAEYKSRYSGLIFCNAIFTCFFTSEPEVYCSYDATQEEHDALVEMANKLYASVFFQPIDVPRPKINEKNIVYCTPEEIERRTRLYEYFLGKTHISTETLDRETLMVFQYCPATAYMPIYQAKQEELRKQNEKFCTDDEFSFSNFDTDLLADAVGGVCAGMARITAEVYNSGAVQTPEGSYTADVLFGDRYVTREVKYNINNIEEMNTFFDRYLKDYREYDGDFDAMDTDALAHDEFEFWKMVAVYWRKTNEEQNDAVAYEDIVLANKPGFVLSWETAELATRYLDNHQILLCTLNINNIYNQGHEVNLVSYTRTERELQDGNKYETVVFDVYDSNYPQGLLQMECYKVPTTNGKYAMLFNFNGNNENYFSSFMGENTEIGDEEGSLCIKFAIFNDRCQCLNVKL